MNNMELTNKIFKRIDMQFDEINRKAKEIELRSAEISKEVNKWGKRNTNTIRIMDKFRKATSL